MLNSTWVYDSWYDRNTWCVPFVSLVRMYAFLQAHAAEGFVISGVYGNYAHWDKASAGGHTNRSTHDLWNTLPAITHTDVVLRRFVPAIDYKLPSGWMDDYERWYVPALRANRFPYIQYININGHHYHRETGYAQVFSSDTHCHEHYAPGFETKTVPLPLERFYNEVMHPAVPPEEDDMDGNTYIRGADILIPGDPEGDSFATVNRPLNWWLTAPYVHGLATEIAVGKIADAVSNIDGLDDKTKAAVESARSELGAVRDTILTAIKDTHTTAPPDPS